jgi:1,4-alpha-glucan branching enzyme
MMKTLLRSVAMAMSLAVLMGAGACGGPPPVSQAMGPEAVEGGILFRYRNPDAKKVNLVGDFNDWSTTADPMTDDNGDGEYTLFYPLGPGTYAYKFLVDGRNWVADPWNPLSEPDGFNGRNSIVKILAATGN